MLGPHPELDHVPLADLIMAGFMPRVSVPEDHHLRSLFHSDSGKPTRKPEQAQPQPGSLTPGKSHDGAARVEDCDPLTGSALIPLPPFEEPVHRTGEAKSASTSP